MNKEFGAPDYNPEVSTANVDYAFFLGMQKKWMALKSNSTELSQAVDVPGFLKNYFDSVVNNLPSYVSLETREGLKAGHPYPVVALTGYSDKRLNRDELKLDKLAKLPHEMSIENAFNYKTGMQIISSLGVEKLTFDTFNNMFPVKGLSMFLEKIISVSPLPRRVELIRKEMGKDLYNGMVLEIAKSVISGETEELSDYLKKHSPIHSIKDLAMFFGGEFPLKIPKEGELKPVTNSTDYPGVIVINPVAYLPVGLVPISVTGFIVAATGITLSAIPALAVGAAGVVAGPVMFMHDTTRGMVSYLCETRERDGILPIEYVDKRELSGE